MKTNFTVRETAGSYKASESATVTPALDVPSAVWRACEPFANHIFVELDIDCSLLSAVLAGGHWDARWSASPRYMREAPNDMMMTEG
jgi:hypothetical protein